MASKIFNFGCFVKRLLENPGFLFLQDSLITGFSKDCCGIYFGFAVWAGKIFYSTTSVK